MSSSDHPEALIPPTAKLSLKNPPAKGESGLVQTGNREAELKRRNRKRKEKKAATSVMQSFLTFLVIGAALGFLFWDQHWGTGYITSSQYRMVRLIAVVGAYVVLVIEAFSHNMIQGVFTLFFPPYSLIYGLIFADGGPVKGFTFAICVFLGVEWSLIHEDSFLTNTGEYITYSIDYINALISGSKRPDP